jgi:polysaccharide export outer membrane protein
MKSRSRLIWLLMGATAVTGDALAQSSQRDPGIATNMVTSAAKYDKRDYLVGFWRLAVVSKDYEMGAGDVIDIDVYGAPELSQVARSLQIPNSGVITLPMVGEVQAAGLTAEAMEQNIAARLKDKGLVERPEVLVTVVEYKAKPVYVIGEVDNPGQYIMSQPWTLTEAILVAGGLDMTAGRFGYLHRRLASDGATPAPPRASADPSVAAPGYEVTRVDLRQMKTGGILDPDPVLKAGDTLVVPAAKIEMAFVIGDVYRPGGVVLPESGTVPVSRALAVAGPTRTSKASDGILVRYEPTGARKELPVDFQAILQGRLPDFDIQPNDVIFVPGSNAKTLGYGLLTSIPQIVQNAAVIAIF